MLVNSIFVALELVTMFQLSGCLEEPKQYFINEFLQDPRQFKTLSQWYSELVQYFGHYRDKKFCFLRISVKNVTRSIRVFNDSSKILGKIIHSGPRQREDRGSMCPRRHIERSPKDFFVNFSYVYVYSTVLLKLFCFGHAKAKASKNLRMIDKRREITTQKSCIMRNFFNFICMVLMNQNLT